MLYVNCVAVSAESHSAASASTDNDGVAVSAESHSAASASTYNEDGLSLENCGSLEPQTCTDPNEEFVQEKSSCPPDTCNALVARIDCRNAPPPQPGCVCKSGYRRLDKTMVCVPLCECPEMAYAPACEKKTCKDPNEEFVQEKPCCPPDTCESLVAKYDCSKSPPPQPGCVCKSGYKRLNETSKCVPLCECPQLASSPDCQPQTCKDPNEEYVKEKPSCPPDTCNALVARYNCTNAPPPQPGCVCKSGYRRLNEISGCVPICECPEMASSPDCPKQTCDDPNEEFVQKKKTCPPDTCISIVARYDCSKSPPPQPGCVCKSGYKRLNETSKCVPICQCPQLASSPDCQPQTCKDPNEEFVQEKPSCPPDTCKALVARYDCTKAPPPQPGCVCKSGYRRLNETSGCVPTCKCPQMASSAQCQQKPKPVLRCGANEIRRCVKKCPPEKTCRNRHIKVACPLSLQPCKEKCVCAPGYYRNYLGTCITEKQCDMCNKKNEFYDCGSACDNECINIDKQNRTNCPIVNIVCNKKCYCEDGYARDESGNCIPVSQCKCQPQTCEDPNEEFVQQKPSCPPDTCESLVSKYDCSEAPPPQPGCVCKSGYKRLNETSKCVPICQCPQLASSPDCQPQTCKDPNEEFVQEKPNCPPDTCNALVAKYNCTNAPPPQPGCVCKSGYRRLNETSGCVPICECPEMTSSAQCQQKPNCQPQTCKDPNEEFVQEKPNCPPDTCNALVARYNCTNAPPPQPGCVCKSGYRRLDETSCCVPICECPEMTSSAQCQQKPKSVLRCGTNEIRSCVKKCPPERTCRNRFIQVACLLDLQPCTEKCVCAPGYYRNYLGTCITEKQCDMCNKKNEFYDCGSACDNECINIDKQNRTNCPIVNIVCNKKCYCEDGYARDESGNCIPVSQCKKPRDPNEEYICTKSCPPDLCIATVARFKCDGNEVPKLQYRCKPGFFREVEGGPCKPKCQCPQMQNSPDCQT
ncbi:hypothetical protein evm_006074 [Chilo suppressalis]|nr:hypothetical protein evm_006074 [Chilo suppressalis]